MGDRAAGIPPLHIDIHVFSANPAERFVFINNRKYVEGATLTEGPVLERIRTGDCSPRLLVAEVRATKDVGANHFALVDAGFNDLMRLAMYGAHHAITAIDALGPDQKALVWLGNLDNTNCTPGFSWSQFTAAVMTGSPSTVPCQRKRWAATVPGSASPEGTFGILRGLLGALGREAGAGSGRFGDLGRVVTEYLEVYDQVAGA